MKTIKVTFYVDTEDDTRLKDAVQDPSLLVRFDEWEELDALYGLKLDTILDDSGSTKDPVIAIKLTQSNAKTNTIGIELRPFESERTARQIIMERVMEVLETKQGWKLIKSANYNFTWDDFIKNIDAFKDAGITLDPANPCRVEILNVDASEQLNTKSYVQGRLVLYNMDNIEFCVFRSCIDLKNGSITFDDPSDEGVLKAWINTGEIMNAEFISDEGETFGLQKSDNYCRLA